MRRYRKVDVGTWADEKFRTLTPLAPSGQALWLYLLTTPLSFALPGLLQAGRLAIAEALEWTLDDVNRCFAEIEGKGMAWTDRANRLVWLPNAIHYNRPESPNVVRAWRSAFETVVPKGSPLRQSIGAQVGNVLRALGQAWVEAWGPRGGREEAERSTEPTRSPEKPREPAQMSKGFPEGFGESGAVTRRSLRSLPETVTEQPSRWEKLLLRLTAGEREQLLAEREAAERAVAARFDGSLTWHTHVAAAHAEAAERLYKKWSDIAARSAS